MVFRACSFVQALIHSTSTSASSVCQAVIELGPGVYRALRLCLCLHKEHLFWLHSRSLWCYGMKRAGIKGGKEREKRGEARSFRINLKDGAKDNNVGKESQDYICFIFWNSASRLLLGILSSFCLSLKVISRQPLLSLQTEHILNFLSYLSLHAPTGP